MTILLGARITPLVAALTLAFVVAAGVSDHYRLGSMIDRTRKQAATHPKRVARLHRLESKQRWHAYLFAGLSGAVVLVGGTSLAIRRSRRRSGVVAATIGASKSQP